MAEQEQAVSEEIEKYYRKAKEIIALNQSFLEKIAEAPARKGMLSEDDVQRIRRECKAVSVVL